MHLEPFAEGKSLIHSFDPRTKILGLLPFIIFIAISKSIIMPLSALVVGIGLVILSRVNIPALLNRLCIVNVFVIFLWLILPFTVAGKNIFYIGPLTITAEGILYVLGITIKTNAIVLSTIVLVGTIPAFKLAHALRHLYVPEKLVLLFFFCYRYVTVLHNDYHSLCNAMKLKAFQPKNNIHTYKSFAYLIGMLLMKSYEHSKSIYKAMRCRGFDGKFPLLSHFKTSKKDYFFLIITFFIMIFLIMIEI